MLTNSIPKDGNVCLSLPPGGSPLLELSVDWSVERHGQRRGLYQGI